MVWTEGKAPVGLNAVRSLASKEKERRKLILLQQQDKDMQIDREVQGEQGAVGGKEIQSQSRLDLMS